MKKILCFGDSNTYGYIAGSGKRYNKDTRWTGILQERLKDKYIIIEGGCNNRNGFIDSNGGIELTGYKVLPEYLAKNPDIVILALGANDIQKFYKPSLDRIKEGLDSMLETIKPIETILISPPILNEDVLKGYFSFQFDEQSIETSKHLPKMYQESAKEHNCHYIDLNNYVRVSSVDGLHYSGESHKIIADVLYNYIIGI